jgi:hypothetical protein
MLKSITKEQAKQFVVLAKQSSKDLGMRAKPKAHK